MKWQSIILILVLLLGCKKEPSDLEEPIISDLKVNGIADSTSANSGDNISITASIDDDTELHQARIRLLPDFSGFPDATDSTTTFEKAELIYIDDATGNSYAYSRSMSLPANATAGPYIIDLRAADAAGRQSDIAEMRLMILNASQPVISVSSPMLDGSADFNPGDTINIAGTVTEDQDLIEVEVSLFDEQGNVIDIDTETLTSVTETTFDLSASTVVIPTGLASGTVDIQFTAVDKDGNVSILSGKINVL